MINFQVLTRVSIATIALAVLLLVSATPRPAQAQGLRNCVDVTGKQSGRVACYEDVWVDGVQLRMTFSNQHFTGATPSDRIGSFYVVAPQTDTSQGTLPFPHDHVVGSVPAHNLGAYRVILHGYFVLCSAEGLSSGACVPTMTTIEGFGTIPFATSVNGQALTSTETIEAGVRAGLLTLVDTGGVLVGSLGPGQ
jgi:hypothetical protein